EDSGPRSQVPPGNGMGSRVMQTQRRHAGPRPRRWSVKEYHRLGDLGFFRHRRVELVEAAGVLTMPINPPPPTSAKRAGAALTLACGAGFHVRAQQPLRLGPRSEPVPDIAVVAGPPEDYRQQHPTTALLLMEVSDRTLWYDRRRKA